MTSIEDVMTLTITYLRSNTGITWHEINWPDDENISTMPYGVLDIKGPFEIGHDDWSIGSIKDQPYGGSLRVGISAHTIDALKAESTRAVALLRGWSPGSGVSAFTTELVGSFDESYTKWRPSQFVRLFQFNFVTAL